MFLRKKLRKVYLKLKSRKGFSFAELLLAVLIMMSATAILTGTISLALAHYRDMTKTTSAQLLCTTLSVYVQNELECATVVKNSDGKIKKNGDTILFRSESRKFGPDAYFVIVNSAGTFAVTENSSEVGMIAETSMLYQNQRPAGTNPFYYLAAEGAYIRRISGLNEYYELTAGMTLKYEESSDSFVVHITVKDMENKLLAKNDLRVIPLGVME